MCGRGLLSIISMLKSSKTTHFACCWLILDKDTSRLFVNSLTFEFGCLYTAPTKYYLGNFALVKILEGTLLDGSNFTVTHRAMYGVLENFNPVQYQNVVYRNRYPGILLPT